MNIGGRNGRPRCCFAVSIKRGSKYIGFWCWLQTVISLVILAFDCFLALYGILLALPPSICFGFSQCHNDSSKNRKILY